MMVFPEKRAGVKRALNIMLKRFEQSDVRTALSAELPTGRYALGQQLAFQQSDTARRATNAREAQRRLPVSSTSLQQRHAALQKAGFSWQSVLAPGISLQALPGWQENEPAGKPVDIEQIRLWLHDPAFQVH